MQCNNRLCHRFREKAIIWLEKILSTIKPRRRIIYLFTDFGLNLYVGQVKSILYYLDPELNLIDLCHDASKPKLAAYLLAALEPQLGSDYVILAIIDPGVGGPRPPIAMRTERGFFVGPGNGLLEIIGRRTKLTQWYTISSNKPLSASFHGRDLFAPVAASLANRQGSISQPWGQLRPCPTNPAPRPDWPDDLNQIIYIDHYGNAMTGLRLDENPHHLIDQPPLIVDAMRLPRKTSFFQGDKGQIFYYRNSLGLAEIAINQDSAATQNQLSLGQKITWGKVND